MPDFAQILRSEIESLEAEISNDPRYKKVESLKNVLALYDSSGKDSDGEPQQGPLRTVTRVPSETRARAMELAELFLRNRAGPTPTRDILDHILSHGGEIGGREPVSNLSAMLSNSGTFQSHGRIGWTLRQNDMPEIRDSDFRDAAQHILADLESQQLLDLKSNINAGETIPADFDSRLLAEARNRSGRLLTDQETKKLRKVFREELDQNIEHCR